MLGNATLSEKQADAKLAYQTAMAQATFIWQRDEATSEQLHAVELSTADHTHAIGLASYQQTYDTALAGASETADHQRAVAVANQLLNQTTAYNQGRIEVTAANIAQQSDQEDARVDVHSQVHTLLALPWTEYLAQAAQARLDWWTDHSNFVISTADDRNTNDTARAGELAGASLLQDQAVATAMKTHAHSTAQAHRDQAVAQADSARDFTHQLAADTLAYRTGLATADQDRALALSQTEHDQAYHLSTSPLDAVHTDFALATAAHASTWRNAELAAHTDKYLDWAESTRDRALDLIAADVAQSTAEINAKKAFHLTESETQLQFVTGSANVDAAASVQEADSLAAATAALALSNGSPWANNDADLAAVHAANVHALVDAAQDKTIAKATVQRDVEDQYTAANAARQLANVNATAAERIATPQTEYALAVDHSSSLTVAPYHQEKGTFYFSWQRLFGLSVPKLDPPSF